MDFKQKIKQIFTQSDGLVIDVFYEIFTIIDSLDSEQQYDAFSYACENAKNFKIDEENLVVVKTHFTEEKLSKYIPKLKRRFVREVEDIIFDSAKNNIPSSVFYGKVWDLISSNRICKTKCEKALAMFMFVDNELIPYIPVGTGLSMDDDEYNSIIDSFDSSMLKQTKMIMQMDYEQKTQKTSLIAEKIEKLDFQEQTVYLSLIFNMIEERIKDELKSKIDSI